MLWESKTASFAENPIQIVIEHRFTTPDWSQRASNFKADQAYQFQTELNIFTPYITFLLAGKYVYLMTCIDNKTLCGKGLENKYDLLLCGGW